MSDAADVTSRGTNTDNQPISEQERIYNALWEAFEPHTRKMTPEQVAEFDGLVDLASRRLADEISGIQHRNAARGSETRELLVP